MFDKWPDVQFVATQNDEVITEVTCRVCGARESVAHTISRDLHLSSRLDVVQKAADYYKRKNELWNSIRNSKVDIFESLYAMKKINRELEKDNKRGLAVPSIQGGRTEISCLKCNDDISFDYDLRTKFDSELPNDIPFDVLKKLDPPSTEILGRMLTRKDKTPIARTIDGIFKLIDEKRFNATEGFITKVKEMSNEIDA